MSDTDSANVELLEAVSDEASELIHHLRCSHAPDEVLAEATGHIRQALQALAPYLRQGEGWSTVSIASDTPGFAWREDDLTRVMPYSPVSGKRNPIAPPIRMWKDGDEVLVKIIDVDRQGKIKLSRKEALGNKPTYVFN